MQTVILDSSVWIAYFNGGDFFHKKAEKILDFLLGKGTIIIVPDIIFAETINALRRNLEETLALYVNNKLKSLGFADLISGRQEFWFEFFPSSSKNQNLKTSDAAILAYTQFFGVDNLLTFDKKLEKAYLKMAN